MKTANSMSCKSFDTPHNLHLLLFQTPTSASHWLVDFTLTVTVDKDWEIRCREVTANEYARNVDALDGYARVGWYLLTQGKAEQALSWFDADAALGRMSWWTGLRHAETLAALGQDTEAEDRVTAIYAQYPEARNGYACLAWRLCEKMGAEGALDWVSRDVQACRLTKGFAINHAVLLAQAGRWPEAVAKVEEGYATDARLKDGYARLAWILVRTQNWATAWKLAERDVHAGRLTPAWRINLAQLLGRLGDFTRATALIEDAYREDAILKNGFAQLAGIAHEVDEPFLAVELLERDQQRGRLSECRQADMLLLKARLFGDWDGESIPGLVAHLEKTIKRGVSDFTTELDNFYDQLRPLWQATAGWTANTAYPVQELLDTFGRLKASMNSSSLGIVLAALRGLEPDRKWQRSGLFNATLSWLSSYRNRLEQALVDWNTASRCYCPAMTDKGKTRALIHSLRIAENMLGRPCGVTGDRLAQYGAVVQLAWEGRKSLRIVELGTLFGGSCMLFLLAAHDMDIDIRAICIDPLDGYYGQELDPVSGESVGEETFWANLDRLGLRRNLVELRRCLSVHPEAFAGLEKGSIDLILIDADHSHKGVLADWHNYSPLVRPGGLVIFDDYGVDHPGVVSAVDQICTSEREWKRLGCLGTSIIVRHDRGSRLMSAPISTPLSVSC